MSIINLPAIDSSIDRLVEIERQKSNTNYEKAKRRNLAANVLLWGSAALTLGILLYILGFILYRGFRSDNIIESDFIDSSGISVPLDWHDGDSVLIVNDKTRLKEINLRDLESLLNGKPDNWGNINSQDLDVLPYMLSSAKGEFGKNTTYRESPSEIVSSVASQPGALGLIPASFLSLTENKDINIIPVKMLSVGVNPSVLEIENNIKLRYIDRKILRKILRGELTNWQEAAGRDMPVRLVLPPPGSFEWDALIEIAGVSSEELAQSAVGTSSFDEFYSKINSTPGAFGMIRNDRAEENNIKLLSYRYRQTGANLQWWFLFEEPKRAGRVGGISTIVLNTIYMVLLTVLFSTPIGIGAAVYLTEYAKQGTLVKMLRLGTETLAGIPSIIFGLFGFIVFVGAMHMGIGLLSGTLTLTLMILPTIIRTSEEAIKGVPRSFSAGSLALGAGKWQTIYKVVLPAAAPGILTGVILAIGRAVGETAALLFTMGFDYRAVKNLSTSARVLSTHLYQLVKEGISFDRAFATATILIFIVLFVNLVSTRLIKRKY
ncbi:MAG: phosphate ABC transporter permease PstA [Spirochaetales bacterium]|nr:phosphate ABC transporter permease PstA [Spirochaetales bacterium]